jgi:hypothetical protein
MATVVLPCANHHHKQEWTTLNRPKPSMPLRRKPSLIDEVLLACLEIRYDEEPSARWTSWSFDPRPRPNRLPAQGFARPIRRIQGPQLLRTLSFSPGRRRASRDALTKRHRDSRRARNFIGYPKCRPISAIYQERMRESRNPETVWRWTEARANRSPAAIPS